VLVSTSPTAVRISFVGVPSYSGGGTMTFQYEVLPSNRVNIYWQACTPTGGDALVGWTPGNGASDPGNGNLSAMIPAGATLCPGSNNVQPISLAANLRPILGTTVTLTTSNLPAGTGLAALQIAASFPNPAIDLTAIGMAGCFAYIDPATSQTFQAVLAPASSWPVAIAIPNNPAFVAVAIGWQSLAFAPNTTAAGIVSSNGLITLLAAQ
jgi:hypothetical protein